MRLFSLHKSTSYLTALAAVAPLLVSPEISASTTALVLAAMAASWFAERPRYRAERYTAAWNIAALLLLAYLIMSVYRGGSAIVAGVHFLLFILVNKLFNRRTNRDYRQTYVISFLMLVAATTLNTGISYAAFLLLYVVFVTWALIMSHLRHEIEDKQRLEHDVEQFPPQQADADAASGLAARPIVSRGFLAGTASLSAAMVAAAVLFFAFFPRIGFGLFRGPRRHGPTLSGFSDRVQLGHLGRIRENPQVIMRVVFGRPGQYASAPPLTLRWRGSAFDYYEANTWSHGPGLEGRSMPVPRRDGVYQVNYARGIGPTASADQIRKNLLRQEIYLEPIDSAVIFAADRPVAVEIEPSRLAVRPLFTPRRGPSGELRAAGRRATGLRYVAYSELAQPDAAVLRKAPLFMDRRFARYLQLPANLPRRVAKLARRITAGHASVYDQVKAVEAYLQQNYRYTLDLTHTPGHDPVDEFLFETRAGHCEYFASAMALLLRAVGIHSRHVNGFIGGQWNAYGNYLAVRQTDAHAWTEVLFANVGWVPFDATPPRDRPASTQAGLSEALRQMLDALRLRWFSYVIEYDLSKQLAILTTVRAALSGNSANQAHRAWLARHRGKLLVAIALPIVLALLLWLSRRRWRERHQSGLRGRQHAHPATTVYRRALQLLERAQITFSSSDPSLTPRERAVALVAQGHRCGGIVAELTSCYYAARFGPQAESSERVERLTYLAAELRDQLDIERRRWAD